MSYSLAAASMNPSAFPTTFTVNTSLPKNQTSSEAVNIGNLAEQGDTITVSDMGQTATTAVSTTFTAQAGDTTNLSQDFGNFVDEYTTRLQLYDSQGNLIADNQGTEAQQQAFLQWDDGTLTLGNGNYTAIATPEAGTGTSVNITSSQQQGTSLGVTGQLTGGDTSQYYNFSLAGTNLKMGFDAGSSTPSTRVQILNANGQIVADSDGDPYQQANYQAITSGTGLTTSAGDYTAVVTYAPTADQTQNINYNFQLYSGTNYAVVYNTNATAQAYDPSAAGSVTATSTAQLYTRQGYNTIGQTAAGATNIGWMAENQSSLSVLSELTSADNADYYSFTLESGDNLKFGFDSTQTANPSAYHVQLYDATGTRLIADNEGTPAQQAAYQALTTTDGLSATPANYVVKISYANGYTPSNAGDQYQFDLYSGTSFASQYKTIASPQTYGNALLAGTLTSNTIDAAGMASFLSSATGIDGIDALI